MIPVAFSDRSFDSLLERSLGLIFIVSNVVLLMESKLVLRLEILRASAFPVWSYAIDEAVPSLIEILSMLSVLPPDINSLYAPKIENSIWI